MVERALINNELVVSSLHSLFSFWNNPNFTWSGIYPVSNITLIKCHSLLKVVSPWVWLPRYFLKADRFSRHGHFLPSSYLEHDCWRWDKQMTTRQWTQKMMERQKEPTMSFPSGILSTGLPTSACLIQRRKRNSHLTSLLQ